MNHVGTIEIKTEKLVLRRFQLDDIEAFYNNYGSDARVHEYYAFVADTSKEATEAFVKDCVAKYDDPTFYMWAVTLDGELIGAINLANVTEDDSAELFYGFGSKWWWNGYATEACKEIKSILFENGLHRMYGVHHLTHVSHGSVLLKLGMEPEGIARGARKHADGTYHDLKVYSVVAE